MTAVPILVLLVAAIAVWALFSRRRRLGLVLLVLGIALITYAVAWTFLPE
ncbi:MAG TPA: hypothetical protein VF365_04945 [Candidatus Limnocylindria bacterium]